MISTVEAPKTLDVRCITEDTPCGLVTYSSMGQMLNVPIPVIDSMITIFSALLGRDFRSREYGARTVEDLGIAGMTPEEYQKLRGVGNQPKSQQTVSEMMN